MDERVVSVREGRRSLTAWVRRLGDDVVVAVGGGDRLHVGCAVLATPVRARDGRLRSPSCSVVTVPPHKEEAIARPVAERIAGELGRLALVTAGVHDDDLDADGIATYLALAERLAEAVVETLRDTRSRDSLSEPDRRSDPQR